MRSTELIHVGRRLKVAKFLRTLAIELMGLLHGIFRFKIDVGFKSVLLYLERHRGAMVTLLREGSFPVVMCLYLKVVLK